MDKISLDRISEAHPKIRQILKDTYIKANNSLGKGCRLRIAYVYRSPEEQQKLYAQKPKVTNAKPWQSIHQYSLAFDIVLLYDNDGDGRFEEVSWDIKKDGDEDNVADWLEVTRIFTEAGFTNGFISKGKKWDLPHFQKDFGMSWQQMKKLIDDGKYKEEVQNNKRIRYINI